MNEHHDIPLNVFTKGRSFEKVLEKYMSVWDETKKLATALGRSEDEIFTDTMEVAAYRIYLLGVEDGMKEENQ